MATTGVDFVLNNNKSGLNAAAFQAIPYVDGFEAQSAIQVSGRVPGGAAFRGSSAVAAGNIILLDGMETMLSRLGCAKNGCFHVTTSGTTGVTIDLTNLATGATSTFGDLTFAKFNYLIFYNLSGLDGVAAAAMTIAPGGSNPFTWYTGTTPTSALKASSRVIFEDTTGTTVDSTHKNILITPTAGGNFALCVGGS